MSELALERRGQEDRTKVLGNEHGSVMLTPAIDEDYWEYRVKVSDEQAVVGFPKFNTIGIGFAVEEDWNTNLPYQSDTEQIFQHIARNKGDDSIPDDDVREAIRMIQEAAREDRSQA